MNKKEESSDSTIEMQEETIACVNTVTSLTNDNPLFTMTNASDDPFKADFEEHSTVEGFIDGNIVDEDIQD